MLETIAQTLTHSGRGVTSSRCKIFPLVQKYSIRATSDRVVVIEVMTSARKKSLNLTLPKGEIRIYQRLLAT